MRRKFFLRIILTAAVALICHGLSFSQEETSEPPVPVDLSGSTSAVPVVSLNPDVNEPANQPMELNVNDINKFIPKPQKEDKKAKDEVKDRKKKRKSKNKAKKKDLPPESAKQENRQKDDEIYKDFYKNTEQEEQETVEMNKPSFQQDFMPDSLPAQSVQRIVTYKPKPKDEAECSRCKETSEKQGQNRMTSLPVFNPKGIPAPGEKREQPKLLYRTSLPIYMPGRLPGPGKRPGPGERPKPGQGLVPGERLKPGTAPGPGGERPKPGPRPGPPGFGPSVSLPPCPVCK